ncbi:MAG: efflux RND transporter permease subunit [Gemmatimonadota bacterium]
MGRALARWAERICRHARAVVLATGPATALLLYYAATHLGINTDTSVMASERLRWEQTYLAYKAAFPQLTNRILIVIEGATPDLADRAQRRLAGRLESESDVFESVYLPDGGEYFDRHALLYLKPEQLTELAENLARFRPWLGRLERDPSLTGLLTALDSAMSGSGADPKLDLVPVFRAVSGAFYALTQGRFYELPWQAVFRGHRPTAAEKRRFIAVRPRFDFSKPLPAGRALSHVHRAIEELGLDGRHGVQVRVTGSVAMKHDELKSAGQGAMQAGSLALVMVGLILYLGLRSLRLVLASLVTLVSGLIGTAAFAAVAVGSLNLISIAFAVLYIGLGIDYAIHLCLRYREMWARGLPRAEAVRVAVEQVGGSLALSALTTAVSFYVFVPTDFAGVSELGLIAGTGMFISLFATSTLLPALLMRLPLPGPEEGRSREALTGPGARSGVWGGAIRSGLGRFVSRGLRARPRVVLWSALALGVACLALLPRVHFDHDPMSLRDPTTESVAAYRSLLADSSATPLRVSVVEPDSVAARRVAERMKELDGVAGTRMLNDFIPRDQARKLRLIARIDSIVGPRPAVAPSPPGDRLAAVERFRRRLGDFQWYTDEATADAARQLRILIRHWQRAVAAWPVPTQALMVDQLETSLVGSLPGRLRALRASLSPDPVAFQSLPEDLVRQWVSETGAYRVEIRPRGRLESSAALRRFVEEVTAQAPDATGPPVSEFETGRVVVRSFRQALLWAVLATAALLLILLRSFVATLLVLAPLALASAMTGAASAGFGLPFNFANVITLPLLLGVGVDNGIHMVHRIRAAPPADGNLLATSTARAIVFSSLTTIAGFGNLAFAAHRGMASMGRLLTLGMLAVLFSTLVILPALLSVFGGNLRPSSRGLADS